MKFVQLNQTLQDELTTIKDESIILSNMIDVTIEKANSEKEFILSLHVNLTILADISEKTIKILASSHSYK